jgi:hypothetical protein
MPSFELVNPLIFGEFNKNFEATSQGDAAANAWNSISKYVIGDVPQFGFTLKRSSDNKLFHFIVKESAHGSSVKDAKFSIEELSAHMTPNEEKKFLSYVGSISNELSNKQLGGKKKRFENIENEKNDDSSSSSSVSDSIYERAKLFQRSNYVAYSSQQPMIYWWYSPVVYTRLVPTYTSYYVPTFIVPLRPYVEIDLNSAFFG